SVIDAAGITRRYRTAFFKDSRIGSQGLLVQSGVDALVLRDRLGRDDLAHDFLLHHHRYDLVLEFILTLSAESFLVALHRVLVLLFAGDLELIRQDLGGL